MVASTAVYAGTDIIITVDNGTGSKIITGLSLVEDAVKITAPERVTKKLGMDGSVAMNISPDKSVILVIKMLATSSDNDIFASYLHSLDLGGSSPGIQLRLVKNNSNFVISGLFWVTGAPSPSFGSMVPDLEWSFTSGHVDFTPGAMGNI